MPEIPITKYFGIATKWHSGFTRPVKPKTIVIHGTGGGGYKTASPIIQWMYDGGRATEYSRGVALFHYIIDVTGEITQIIDPNRYVFHSSSGNYFDPHTIGIELVNVGEGKNNGAYNNDQYSAVHSLIFDYLFEKYPIKEIMSHNYTGSAYAKSSKLCPGPLFDWDITIAAMTSRFLNFSRIGNEEYFFNITS